MNKCAIGYACSDTCERDGGFKLYALPHRQFFKILPNYLINEVLICAQYAENQLSPSLVHIDNRHLEVSKFGNLGKFCKSQKL